MVRNVSSKKDKSLFRIAFCNVERSFVNLFNISNTASLFKEYTSRHIIGLLPAKRVKSLKPAAEYFITSSFKCVSNSIAVDTMEYAINCGICDVIANTLSWCSASIVSICIPIAVQNCLIILIVSLLVLIGVIIQNRFTKSWEKPNSAPLFSVPAMGWLGKN